MLGSRGAKIPGPPPLKNYLICMRGFGGRGQGISPPPGKISKLLFSHIKLL